MGSAAGSWDSHWVHERASYRCRHGRTSARSSSPTRPKILYVREDHLLVRIRGDRRLHRQLIEQANSDPGADAVATCLRANDMIIVCDHHTWAVESDTTRIELAPMTTLGLPHQAFPLSEDGR